jgi:ribosomal protein L19
VGEKQEEVQGLLTKGNKGRHDDYGGLVMKSEGGGSRSSVALREEHKEVKLGSKMEPVEGDSDLGCFI